MPVILTQMQSGRPATTMLRRYAREEHAHTRTHSHTHTQAHTHTDILVHTGWPAPLIARTTFCTRERARPHACYVVSRTEAALGFIHAEYGPSQLACSRPV